MIQRANLTKCDLIFNIVSPRIPVVGTLSSWSSKKNDLIIGPILLPSQVFSSCWRTENRWCQIRKMWKVINQFKAIVTHSCHCNHIPVCRSIVLTKQDSLRHFYRPFWLDCISQLPKQVGIEFPIDSLTFLKVVNEHNALCIPEHGGHDLSCRWNHLGIRWKGEKRCFHCTDCRSTSGSKWSTQLISGEEMFKKTGWICCKKSAKFTCEWPALCAFDQASKLWQPQSGNLRRTKFVVQNVLYYM